MLKEVSVWITAFFGSDKEFIEVQFVEEKNPNWVIFFIDRKKGKEQLSAVRVLSGTRIPLNEFLDSLRSDRLLEEVYLSLRDKTGWNHLSRKPVFISGGTKVFKIIMSENPVSPKTPKILTLASV